MAELSSALSSLRSHDNHEVSLVVRRNISSTVLDVESTVNDEDHVFLATYGVAFVWLPLCGRSDSYQRALQEAFLPLFGATRRLLASSYFGSSDLYQRAPWGASSGDL